MKLKVLFSPAYCYANQFLQNEVFTSCSNDTAREKQIILCHCNLESGKLERGFFPFSDGFYCFISREKSENKLARKIFQSKMKLPPPNSADKSNSIENHISKGGPEEISQNKSFYWVSVRGGAVYRIIGIFQWLISTAGPVLRFLTLSARKSFDGPPLWQIVWVAYTFHGAYWIKKPDLLRVFACSIQEPSWGVFDIQGIDLSPRLGVFSGKKRCPKKKKVGCTKFGNTMKMQLSNGKSESQTLFWQQLLQKKILAKLLWLHLFFWLHFSHWVFIKERKKKSLSLPAQCEYALFGWF